MVRLKMAHHACLYDNSKSMSFKMSFKFPFLYSAIISGLMPLSPYNKAKPIENTGLLVRSQGTACLYILFSRTGYGPEGRGFESLTAYHREPIDFNGFAVFILS